MTGAPRNLVFISDGTLSTLKPGCETNAGQVLRLLEQVGRSRVQHFDYDPGVQGNGWRRWFNAATGNGINLSIIQGYRFLASRYQTGDRIYLFGYSRGAYAVRSLAGMIGSVGLLRQEMATERNIRRAFRFYERQDGERQRRRCLAFAEERCHGEAQIEMLGVWDTVRALGLPYPGLSRLAPMATDFHDHALGGHIRHGYHALAIDEDRSAFAPILWRRSHHWEGRLEQAWFPGVHGDVGGDIRRNAAARPFANLSLNWMLRRAADLGLALPEDWRAQFPEDSAAPSVGPRRGAAKFYLLRQPRVTGRGDGEIIHLSIRERIAALAGYQPRGRVDGR
ncbi:MAG: DUF2235 domain-containing protein [Paracoccaceae bacterium]|nr:DUF2235 domain-containing protein [Paracoccaceae bacterium]